MSAMTEKSWTVVQFEDSSVEAVPTTWIQGDICHWPSMAHPKLVMAIRKSEPLNTCWPTHKIKVFRNATFDDYMKARSKARTAEETSDLASDFEIENKRKRIQKVLSSSDESIEESLLPSPPKKKNIYNEIIKSNPGNRNGKDQKEVKSSEDVNLLDSHFIIPEISCHPTNPTKHSTKSNESQEELADSDHCCKGCQHNGEKLKTVIAQNHLLRSLAAEILSELQKTRGQDNNSGTHCDESLFIKYNLSFPLNSEEEFLKFDEILKTDMNFNEAVKELAKIGGMNNYNMVKRILTSLLTNEEAMKYSWLGRKGKKPFYNLKITDLVISSVEKANMARTRKETEMSIQAWLKRARERKDTTKKF